VSSAVQHSRVVAEVQAAPRPRRTGAPRPPLEVVAPRSRRIRRRSLAPILSGALVSVSLLVVVIGHAELAQGQMRLAGVQSEITSARLLHQREGLALANLENPSRILRVAEETLHMVPPSEVRQLAHVPLSDPLPAPRVTHSTGTSSTRTSTSGG
jgi:hypothetical protein